MGNFRSNARGGGGGFRGRDSGSRGRDSGRFNRRSHEMHDATCSKCGKPCQVPFRPTGDKPVFCNDCFKNNDGSGGNFNSRSQDRSSLLGAGESSNQLSQINAKLDKVLQILENLEIEVEEEDGDEDLDEDLDDEEEDSDDDDDDDDEEDEEEDEEDYSKISLVKDA